MIRMTKSMKDFLVEKHKDLIVPLTFGHLELFTEELQKEYYEYLKQRVMDVVNAAEEL